MVRAKKEKLKVKEMNEQEDLINSSLKRAPLRSPGHPQLRPVGKELLKSRAGGWGPGMEGWGGVVVGIPCSPGISKAGKE